MNVNAIVYEAQHFRIQPRRIVVATADPRVRELVASRLRAEGLHVVEFDSAQDLLMRVARRGDEDVQDAQLYVVDGASLTPNDEMDVVLRLRAADAVTPIVLLASRVSPRIAERLEDLGIASAFERPFDFAEVCSATIDALEP